MTLEVISSIIGVFLFTSLVYLIHDDAKYYKDKIPFSKDLKIK